MVPVTFATCFAMQLDTLTSILCSWLVLIDTLFIGISRVHLNDVSVLLSVSLTHLLAIYACTQPIFGAYEGTEASGGTARSQTAMLAATGIALGCALQCKFAMALTTFAWVGLQNVVVLAQAAGPNALEGACTSGDWSRTRRVLLEGGLRGGLLIGLPLAIHVSVLFVHVSLVPHSGNGDNYMSAAFQ